MRADSFNSVFNSVVGTPLTHVGFEPWGKSLWLEDRGLRAALLRTELRSTWPFQLTLVIGHSCLRDFQDRVPATRSRNVSEWPIKWRPSQARSLGTDHWSYEPWNLGRYPQDTMDASSVEAQLAAIGDAMLDVGPSLHRFVSPNNVLNRLRQQQAPAWCEVRWIEDYERHLAAPGQPRMDKPYRS